MKNIELLEQAIIVNSKEDSNQLIKQFLLSNQLQSNKFNPFDYCDPKDFRSALRGVLHRDGCKIATDSLMLIVLKEDYPVELEGKIIDKMGSMIDANFPDFVSVIPRDENCTFVKIDSARIFEIEKQYKIDKKLKLVESGYVTIQGVCLQVALLAKMVRFANKIGTDEIGLQEPNRATKFGKGTTNCGLLMPMTPKKDYSQIKEYIL